MLLGATSHVTLAEESSDPGSVTQETVWVTSIAKLGDGDDFVAATASGLLFHPSKVVKFSASDPSERMPLYEHPAAVWCVDGSADAKTVVSVDYRGNLIVYDVETATHRMHELAMERWCQAMMLSPDGSAVIAGNEAGKVMIWDLAEAKVKHEASIGEQSITDMVLSPDQTMLVVTDASGHAHVLSWPSLEPKAKIKFGEEAAWSVAFGRDGQHVYVGSGDRQLYQAELSDGAKPTVFGKGDDWLTNLAVSDSGAIVAGQPNGKVHFFSATSTDTSPASSLASPSGVWAVHWNGENELLVGTRKNGVMQIGQSWNWIPADE
ncbi:WD domain, G-beta repeat [Rubripirellula amarantea]|uniref:WD domain, G-beta repeat n=1 Tax=Rubripirellula amarantea TaxID=2527999 RepID=A0A5C5WPD0_9BACT|nr:hypothetical protein [Rubripirellula amarantea]TWT52427.1 WD domain, G-beta repeat [Rubripirellula amarantea]